VRAAVFTPAKQGAGVAYFAGAPMRRGGGECPPHSNKPAGRTADHLSVVPSILAPRGSRVPQSTAEAGKVRSAVHLVIWMVS
jgi:hypothetical protein